MQQPLSAVPDPAVEPVYLSSYYRTQGDPAAGAYHYLRGGNPNWTALETELGKLEQARSLVFASGMAAVHATLLALTPDRPRVILFDVGYYESRRLAQRMQHVDAVVLAAGDYDTVERAAAERPSVVWLESPTNPLLQVVDIQRMSEIAKKNGGVVAVDNTTATPILQQPLDLGAAVSVYSLTKSMSGHSDLLLGSIATRDDDLFQRIQDWRTSGGAIAGPFETWLALRGLKTVRLRVERQSENAAAIARFLAGHPAVTAVHYPGLDPDPVLDRQMPRGAGPLLSFEVRDIAAADAVIAGARLINPGTSFGGVETSWERRSRWPTETALGPLIRLSAGIEPVEEILEDLERALSLAE